MSEPVRYLTSAYAGADGAVAAHVLDFCRRFGASDAAELVIVARAGDAARLAGVVEAVAAREGVALEANLVVRECDGEAMLATLVADAVLVLDAGCEAARAAAAKQQLPVRTSLATQPTRVHGTAWLHAVPDPSLPELLRRLGREVVDAPADAPVAVRAAGRGGCSVFVTADPAAATLALTTPGIGGVLVLVDDRTLDAGLHRYPLGGVLDGYLCTTATVRDRAVGFGLPRGHCVVAGPSGFPPELVELLLARCADAPPAAGALDLLLLCPYMVSPALNGGAVRIASLFGSMPASVGVTGVTVGGAMQTVVQPFTRNRPARELQIARSNALNQASALLNRALGVAGEDVATSQVLVDDDFAKVLALCAEWEPAAAILAHPYLVPQPAAAGLDVPLVYDSHNVEADLKDGIYPDTPGGRAAARLIDDLEREACERAVVTVACSEDDRLRLHERFGLPLERTYVVPNGVDTRANAFVPFDRRGAGATHCVFSGSDHPPNLEALLFICDAARRLPHVQFDIVGTVGRGLREPAPANVRLHGRVSDEEKAAIYAGATFALNPMASGSGSNLKVADYAAAGLPVMTTPFGARGFVPELVDCFTVHEPSGDALAEAIVAATRRDWSSTAATARRIVEQEYDWASLAERYARVLASSLAATAVTA